jgi:tetratricopeptide (TPR) repeat protein
LILGILYFFLLSPKEERFIFAGHLQGSLLSQKMFDVLTYQYPDYSDAYFEQSVALNKYGNFAKGFELLDQAVELDPYLHLGYRGYMKLRFLRDFDGALKDFNRLDSLTPNVVDAAWGEDIDFLRGECFYGKKDYQKAIKMFNRNIKNHTEEWVDINSMVYLGLCEYELGNYKKSISEFHRALNQSEYTAEAYFGIAKAHHKLGEVDEAKENIVLAEKNIGYKRDDAYNEYLNEIYLFEILDFKQKLNLGIQ